MRVRFDPFIVLLLGSAALGILLPAGGTTLHVVTALTEVAIALLFFLHGARLPTAEVIRGLTDWRVHSVVLLMTFVLFPLVGVAVLASGDALVPAPIAAGIVFLCLVPSTVQASVALTSISGGDRSIAVVAASMSSLIGVIVTPLLVGLLLGASATTDASAAWRIVGLLLVPFLLGQLSRRVLHDRLVRHGASLVHVDRYTVLFVVYVGFSNGTRAGMWSSLGWQELTIVVVACAILLAASSGTAWFLGRPFGRARAIAVYFAGTNKSLAAGLPMALILFPESTFGLMILPLMIYHQMQLTAGAFIANRLARTAPPEA